MTQSNQPNDSGAQQSAEAQQSTAEQLQQKAEEVLAAVTPQATSAAAAAQKHLGKAHISRGCITFEDLEDLVEMHNIYHDSLNGNGYLDKLMSQVGKLDIVERYDEYE